MLTIRSCSQYAISEKLANNLGSCVTESGTSTPMLS